MIQMHIMWKISFNKAIKLSELKTLSILTAYKHTVKSKSLCSASLVTITLTSHVSVHVYIQICICTNILGVLTKRIKLNVIIHSFIHSFNKYLLHIYSVPGTFLGARKMERKRKVPACMSFSIDIVDQMVITAMEKNKESGVRRHTILYRVTREGLFKITLT